MLTYWNSRTIVEIHRFGEVLMISCMKKAGMSGIISVDKV